MSTTAKRLAQQLLSLPGNCRSALEALWNFVRGYRATRTRSAAEIRRTAIHEAGHAVVLIALGLAFSAVSIVPDFRAGMLGWVGLARDDHSFNLRTLSREALSLRYAMVYYAGAEAVRQLLRTDPDPDAGASTDKRLAAELIRHRIGAGAGSRAFLFSLAQRRCASLVTHYQTEIQALAGALEAERVLSGRAARRVFTASLTGRGGRPLTFTSDPTLNGLAGDEAFRIFMRTLSLPGRGGAPGRS